jgi:serine/threonine protein kinase
LKPERWQQISRIFKSAISLDGEARAAYVKDECGDDNSLRAEVEKLIESHQHANSEEFIEGVAAEAGAALLVEGDEHDEQHGTLTKGQQLGSYVILDALGAGGMGEVYLARDSRLDRTVALKVLSPDVSSDKRRMQRFRQEAKVASSLNQPNILTIYESGEVDGLTFLATEFIDGETLRSYLRGKHPKLGEILDITIQIVAALDAAHEANIVHRDMKPENVMIRRRDHVVKVLDFGLAKLTEKKSGTVDSQESDLEAATELRTAPGSLMGTINYMSPEQAQMHEVDQRTDIWSTGVMMYEMVAGELPFNGATSSHTIVQIMEREPAPLAYQGQPAPPELRRIVSKAIAKDPEERYQTSKDLLIDLRQFKKQWELDSAGEHFSADKQEMLSASTPAASGRSAFGKRKSLIAITAIVAVLAAIVGVTAWRASRQENPGNANPAADESAVERRRLTYWITVQKFRDKKPYKQPFTRPGEIIFEEDDEIRVNVRSPQGGYLYVLNEGPREPSAPPDFVLVFPSPTANNGSSLVAAEQVVQIPEKTWLRFDQQHGTELLWLIFSENAIPELEGVKEFAGKESKGLITDAAQRQVVENWFNTQRAGKPSFQRDDKLTTVMAFGKLLVFKIPLDHL